jgi:hypothetical protein
VQKLCEINPVTNVQGKGRDDFKLEVLIRAELLASRPSSTAAIKKVSE